MSRADLVVAVGDEVRRGVHHAIRGGAPSGDRHRERARPRTVPSPARRRRRAHHTHLRGCSDATEAARSFRGGSASPACRGSFVPCRAGRRRAALPTPCRHGGRARGRASRFSLRRTRTPPPIGRAGLYQPPHRRGHAGSAHRGRPERPRGRIDPGARGHVRARRRLHGGDRRRRCGRVGRGGGPAPGRPRPPGRHGVGGPQPMRDASSPSTSWPSGGEPLWSRWCALRAGAVAAAGRPRRVAPCGRGERRWCEGPSPSDVRCARVAGAPTRSGADRGGARKECTAARGRTASSLFVPGRSDRHSPGRQRRRGMLP